MCGFGTLIHDNGTVVDIKPSGCGCWSCEECAEGRRARLAIEAKLGRPNKMMTLTCRPRPGQTPLQRRAIMARNFPKLMKRIARKLGEPVAYASFVERTKRGEPHFHVLMRCGFIHKGLLVKWWKELTGWYIVDIKKIEGTRKAANYVTKYIAKEPAKFGTFKRYWKSRNYKLPPELKEGEVEAAPEVWSFTRDDPVEAGRAYTRQGWQIVPTYKDTDCLLLVWPLWGARAPPESPYRGVRA